MFVLVSSSPAPLSKTFIASETWPAPVSTSRLESISGVGADGAPSSSSPAYDEYVRHDVYRNGVLVNTIGPTFSRHAAGAKPDDYMEQTNDPDNFANFDQFWHTFTSRPDVTAATTGASSTAFGKTFPGGLGGPGSVTTFSNVTVTPGQPYNVVVPSGGSITITYYQ